MQREQNVFELYDTFQAYHRGVAAWTAYSINNNVALILNGQNDPPGFGPARIQSSGSGDDQQGVPAVGTNSTWTEQQFMDYDDPAS